MGKAYYYFATSLPYIQFDDKPPMTCEDYLGECQRLLPDVDYKFMRTLLSEKILDYVFLQKLLVENKGEVRIGNQVYDKGIRFNRSFRNEVAWFRAERAGKDPSFYIRGERDSNPKVLELIQQLDKISNPLDAERMIEKFRWEFVDELSVGHYFDIEFLTTYGFKLKILERLETFKSDKGREVFEEIKKIKIEV
ncbi:MAG: DUF2764 family protein [Candidatus Omnitrophica bacterium]|nr:DUF2764 family protein [Candidatus Omnitrophota bacterium]MCB9747182.1 DUF2764 family protein [Candidatus Omnitrophota bacterium]